MLIDEVILHHGSSYCMKRIVILGSSGAGKSTLARELSSILRIKAYHLDRLFWLPGWIRKDRETRIDILQNLVREKQWIIEGNYFNSSDLHLLMADTVIFSDLSSLECLVHLIKRHYRNHARPRRDIPEGCTDKLTLHQMVKVQTFPLNDRRAIKHKLIKCKSKPIVRLRSSNEVDEFLERLKLISDERETLTKEFMSQNKESDEEELLLPTNGSAINICMSESPLQANAALSALIVGR